MSTWEDNVRKVIPYTPGEQPNQPDMIKLNTNENPYPPAPGVEKALRGAGYRYPETISGSCSRKSGPCHCREIYSLKDEQVFVGVGSDDVLAMSFLTFFNSEKPVLFPDITYSFYDVWADLFRIPYECPALDERFPYSERRLFQGKRRSYFPKSQCTYRCRAAAGGY